MSTEVNNRQRATLSDAEGSSSETAVTDRIRSLTEQLRCLVCQNQTIADSNAGLAIDLRQQVVQQVKAGKTDGEIKQYMVERYGDFVLYNPPLSPNNSVLWIGPFILLALGLLLVWRSVLRRPPGSSPSKPGTRNPANHSIHRAEGLLRIRKNRLKSKLSETDSASGALMT
ncbi:MAG: cytochrome c-type biogenesis protein CcmH [Betaproteobacteria bacterium]|nr:cytochrome c-type biogenesis protein CcmH [Betaproteobacteria bacterium]